MPDHYLDHPTVCGPYLAYIPHMNGNKSPASVPPPAFSFVRIFKVSNCDFLLKIPIFFHPLFAATFKGRRKKTSCTSALMYKSVYVADYACGQHTHICTNCGLTQTHNFRGCCGYPSCLIGLGIPHRVDLVSL